MTASHFEYNKLVLDHVLKGEQKTLSPLNLSLLGATVQEKIAHQIYGFKGFLLTLYIAG